MPTMDALCHSYRRTRTDDGDPCRCRRCVQSDCFRENPGNYELPEPICPRNANCIHHNRATIPAHDFLVYLGGAIKESSRLSAVIPSDSCGLDELQPLSGGVVRLPHGFARPKNPDSEVRGSSIRLCGVDPAKRPLSEAPRRTPQDVPSDPRNLLQVAGQPNPLIRSRPSTDRL